MNAVEQPGLTPAGDAAPERQVDALRQEIRQAGAARSAGWMGVLGMVGVACLIGLALHAVSVTLPGAWGSAALLVPCTLLCIPIWMVGVERYRRERLKVVRRGLPEIPPPAAHRMLLDLLDEEDQSTRRLAQGLLRELQLSTELSPAALPGGRGTELAGTEKTLPGPGDASGTEPEA